MRVKANVSFCGEITMRKGEEREIEKGDFLSSLLEAGYISEVKAESVPGTKKPKTKKGDKNEG